MNAWGAIVCGESLFLPYLPVVQDGGCRMQDAGCRMQDAGCRMQTPLSTLLLFRQLFSFCVWMLAAHPLEISY